MRSGYNGSIADILEASGYNSGNEFKVDEQIGSVSFFFFFFFRFRNRVCGPDVQKCSTQERMLVGFNVQSRIPLIDPQSM